MARTIHSGETEEEFLRRIGLHPDRDLAADCADFYLLERMDADRLNLATRRFHSLVGVLSREYSTYLVMVIGGELRHILIRRAYGVRLTAPPVLDEWIQQTWDKTGDSRSGWWRLFMEESGPSRLILVSAAIEAFSDEAWGTSPGAGGQPWAVACRVLRDYLTVQIKPRMFVDRCFTLEHCHACIFDKVYDIEHLAPALNVQASNDYETLAHRFASHETRRVWDRWLFEKYSEYDPAWFGAQRAQPDE